MGGEEEAGEEEGGEEGEEAEEEEGQEEEGQEEEEKEEEEGQEEEEEEEKEHRALRHQDALRRPRRDLRQDQAVAPGDDEGALGVHQEEQAQQGPSHGRPQEGEA